jgi:hypothetical protein
MKYPYRLTRVSVSASACLVLAGYFSYETNETVVPAVEAPVTTTSSTTTTSATPNTRTTVNTQHTATYTNTSP